MHYLDEMLRDVWAQYHKFVCTLEGANAFCHEMMKKYKTYYKDYNERIILYMKEVETRHQQWEVAILQGNIKKILKIGEKRGHLGKVLDEKYFKIRTSVMRVKEGSEIAEAAIVCRSNRLRYPDECY